MALEMTGRGDKANCTASSSAPPPPPPWIELPHDVTADILQRLSVEEILDVAQKVCTTWRSVCKGPSVWRKIHMSYKSNAAYDSDVMCRYAIDRSQGQLRDFRICGFGNDFLLNFVADRSSQLRCLSLVCSGITEGGLAEATKKFPLLEELHLYYEQVTDECIEMIGRSCPLLKSFTLSKPRLIGRRQDYDGQALAIAKTMPQLRHLCLFGNRMSNQGLLAILDRCTRLESLDLRMCTKVDLSGDLGKRCYRQIQSLKKPNDCTADFEYENEVVTETGPVRYGYSSSIYVRLERVDVNGGDYGDYVGGDNGDYDGGNDGDYAGDDDGDDDREYEGFTFTVGMA